MREKGHRQYLQRETLTSEDNQQERGRTMSLTIVVVPTLTIIHEVGLWLHGRSRQSLSVPININIDVVFLRRHGRCPQERNV